MELERRRLVALRESYAACNRLVEQLPRRAPRTVVRAAKAVCNDILADIVRLRRRVASRSAKPS